MLVLKRFTTEEIVISIGDKQITVVVCDAGNGWARLGFKAPSDFTIHRREIQQRVEDGKKKS